MFGYVSAGFPSSARISSARRSALARPKLNSIPSGSVSEAVWLQACSWMLPITHALNGIRGAFRGASPAELAPELLWLAVATAALVPLSVYFFQLAVARAKVDGTLGQY